MQAHLWSKMNSKYYPKSCRLFSESCGCWWGCKSQIKQPLQHFDLAALKARSAFFFPDCTLNRLCWKVIHPHWLGQSLPAPPSQIPLQKIPFMIQNILFVQREALKCPETLAKEKVLKFRQWFIGILLFCCIRVACGVILGGICYIKHRTASLLSPLLFIHYTGCGIWQMYRQSLTAVFSPLFSPKMCLKSTTMVPQTPTEDWHIQSTKTLKKNWLSWTYSTRSPPASQKAKIPFMCILNARSLLVLIKKSCHIGKKMCQLERSQVSIENKWGR